MKEITSSAFGIDMLTLRTSGGLTKTPVEAIAAVLHRALSMCIFATAKGRQQGPARQTGGSGEWAG